MTRFGLQHIYFLLETVDLEVPGYMKCYSSYFSPRLWIGFDSQDMRKPSSEGHHTFLDIPCPWTRQLTASWSAGGFRIWINKDISGVPELSLPAIRQKATRKFSSSAVWVLRHRSGAAWYKHLRFSVIHVMQGVVPEHCAGSALSSKGGTIVLTLDRFLWHSVQARETLRRCFVRESHFRYRLPNSLSLGRSSRRRIFLDIAGLDEWWHFVDREVYIWKWALGETLRIRDSMVLFRLRLFSFHILPRSSLCLLDRKSSITNKEPSYKTHH